MAFTLYIVIAHYITTQLFKGWIMALSTGEISIWWVNVDKHSFLLHYPLDSNLHNLGPVAQRVGNASNWINHCPVDKC